MGMDLPYPQIINDVFKHKNISLKNVKSLILKEIHNYIKNIINQSGSTKSEKKKEPKTQIMGKYYCSQCNRIIRRVVLLHD